MKKYPVVIAIVALLSIFATTLPAAAQAEVVKEEFTVVFEPNSPVEPCDGSGLYNIVRVETEVTQITVVDGQGRTHSNRKTKGTFTYENATTGDTYVATTRGIANNNPNTRSIITKLKLTLPDNQYLSTTKIKTITNANGETVVDTFETTVKCR